MPDGGIFSYLFLAWLGLGLAYYELRRRALLIIGVDLQALATINEEEF